MSFDIITNGREFPTLIIHTINNYSVKSSTKIVEGMDNLIPKSSSKEATTNGSGMLFHASSYGGACFVLKWGKVVVETNKVKHIIIDGKLDSHGGLDGKKYQAYTRVGKDLQCNFK